MAEIGPVEYMVVACPGNKFTGDIAPALAELVESGLIRIIDLAFVAKGPDGEIAAFELGEIEESVRRGIENVTGSEFEGLLNEDDMRAAAEDLEPNSSAALLVWEDLWAAKFAKAVRDAGGVLLEIQRIPHEVVQEAHDFAVANA
jgi:hypothetical protein